jgi:hypothetical protein
MNKSTNKEGNMVGLNKMMSGSIRHQHTTNNREHLIEFMKRLTE